jgi:hypothetical protein
MTLVTVKIKWWFEFGYVFEKTPLLLEREQHTGFKKSNENQTKSLKGRDGLTKSKYKFNTTIPRSKRVKYSLANVSQRTLWTLNLQLNERHSDFPSTCEWAPQTRESKTLI